ncbi:MAG: HEAT repeat domain-containing protein, partial [Candidatus Marinimicrobia bacterium]|nr:HEAT repeat domain-containing protein [Candidatus Neomarinimicrobiota bacterium]
MNCEKFKDILINNDILELPSNIKEKMDEHRDDCIECAEYWEEQQAFVEMLKTLPEPEISDDKLDHLHTNIMQRIQKEAFHQNKQTPITTVTQIRPWWTNISIVAATLLIGLVIGRFIPQSTSPIAETSSNPVLLTDGYDIENIKIQVVNHSTGDLEIEFSQTKDQKVSGNVNDPYIQKLLAYAMVKDENPGTRLRSVKLSTEMRPGEEILSALITTVKSDENNGVRLKAMKALSKFSLNENIKQLCVDVIAHDDYPAMRMQAIQILTESEKINEEDDSVLKKAAEEDDAEGVRSLINQYY